MPIYHKCHIQDQPKELNDRLLKGEAEDVTFTESHGAFRKHKQSVSSQEHKYQKSKCEQMQVEI